MIYRKLDYFFLVLGNPELINFCWNHYSEMGLDDSTIKELESKWFKLLYYRFIITKAVYDGYNKVFDNKYYYYRNAKERRVMDIVYNLSKTSYEAIRSNPAYDRFFKPGGCMLKELFVKNLMKDKDLIEDLYNCFYFTSNDAEQFRFIRQVADNYIKYNDMVKVAMFLGSCNDSNLEWTIADTRDHRIDFYNYMKDYYKILLKREFEKKTELTTCHFGSDEHKKAV